MLNPRADIIKSFGAALSGLTYDGSTVPVYGTSPQKAPATIYIQLGSVITTETGCKDGFGHECTMDIQIIDNSRANRATQKNIEEVTTLVLNTIKSTTTSVVSMTDFEMIWLTLSNSINDVQLFDTSYAPRNILQFSFEINETRDNPCLTSIWYSGTWAADGIWLPNCTWVA
jgi:hypothetical protein